MSCGLAVAEIQTREEQTDQRLRACFWYLICTLCRLMAPIVFVSLCLLDASQVCEASFFLGGRVHAFDNLIAQALCKAMLSPSRVSWVKAT